MSRPEKEPAEQNSAAGASSKEPNRFESAYRAIMSASWLGMWEELNHFYPTNVNQDERRLHKDILIRGIEQALSLDGVITLAESLSHSEQYARVRGVLPYLVAESLSDDDTSGERLMRDAAQWSSDSEHDPLQQIISRLHELAVYECRTPHPEDDDNYICPQRSVYMLDRYSLILQRIVQADMKSLCGFQPHPLLRLIVNLQDRMNTCFQHLGDVEGKSKTEDAVSWMFTTLRDGDRDEFQAVPEYTNRELSKVRIFLEDAYLKLGRGSLQSTWAEEEFLAAFGRGANDHEHAVKRAWDAYEKNSKAENAKGRENVEAQMPDEQDYQLARFISTMAPKLVMNTVRQAVVRNKIRSLPRPGKRPLYNVRDIVREYQAETTKLAEWLSNRDRK